MPKILFAWSSGKDSALAIHELRKQGGYEIVSLLTTLTREYDRVSMHGVRRALLERQAAALGLPLTPVFIPTPCTNEEYEARMQETLGGFKTREVSTVAFGDIFLEDIRKYREDNLAKIGMKAIFPLWNRDTREVVASFLKLGFQAIITCVDVRKLDKSFAGRVIDERFIADLPPGVDPAGENGEYHSFAFAGPIFKEKIEFEVGEKVLRDSFFYFSDLLPKQETP